jgi:hypothetical protein
MACIAGAAAAAPAGDAAPGIAAGASSTVVGAGVVESFDPDPRGLVSFEYRYAAGPLRPSPWIAAEATAGDRFFGFGGFVDVPLGRRFVLSPSLGAGLYVDGGDPGLGWHLEFRSSLELTWRAGATRVGAAFAHYSNAGLGDANPGTEALLVRWVLPVR